MISKIVLAAQGMYRPKNYTEAEHELTYQLWKFGGPQVANLYAKACGGPHTSTVACHREVPPLIVSHAAPTKTEMVQNIGILYSRRSACCGLRRRLDVPV